MTSFTIRAALALSLACALPLVLTPALAQQVQTPSEPVIRAGTIQLPSGQQRLIRMPHTIDRLAIGDPDTAGVNVTGDREVMLTGKQDGETSLLVWMQKADEPTRFPVIVGSQDRPAVLDAQRNDFSSQVQTDIQIAEVSRNTLRQIGFNFASNSPGKSAIGVSAPGRSAGISGLGGGLSLLSNTGFQPIGDAFNLVVSDSSKNTAGFLSILERRGLMRILAQPSLVAMSGQTATFLAGGEFPIPVTQGGGAGGNTAITIQFKQFGIQLSLTPTVLSRDRIVLKIAPSVSELDFSSGVTLNGIQVPGLRKRRTDTTVELGDGQSFILSGLVDQNMAASVDKVPWLGDIPIIGSFFRATNYQRQNRELIMVVTPHLVAPLAAGTKVELPGEDYDNYNPSSAQLFLNETGDFNTADQTGFSH